MIIFTRYKKNPIIRPSRKHAWEAKKTYNPGVVYENGKFLLFYRAKDKNNISSLGFAESKDGIKFKRKTSPLFSPKTKYEKMGVEDPRITKINNKYYLTYTAYDGDVARLCLATSRDMKKWQRHGPMLRNWNFYKAHSFDVAWDQAQMNSKNKNKWSKAGAIFPQEFNGKYLMLFGDRNIWIATSQDTKKWDYATKPFLEPRKKYFDNLHIEMGPPPILTKHGWLALYHGIDSYKTYRLGYILLDKNNPQKILKRSTHGIFEPRKTYEMKGRADIKSTSHAKAYVIFCNGAVLLKNTLHIFYGSQDTYVSTAKTSIHKLLK